MDTYRCVRSLFFVNQPTQSQSHLLSNTKPAPLKMVVVRKPAPCLHKCHCERAYMKEEYHFGIFMSIFGISIYFFTLNSPQCIYGVPYSTPGFPFNMHCTCAEITKSQLQRVLPCNCTPWAPDCKF